MEILGTRLKSFLYPYIGSRPVKEITAQELLAALRRIEARGKHETAHRVRALAARVLRFAVATGRAERDVAADLKDALAPVKSRNFASVTDPEGKECDLEGAEWRIPGVRLKMGEQHIVPLSRQAVAILKELQVLTGGWRYVFPSLLSRERPMSDNTINSALRRLGYSGGEQTGHGFRTMASTLLNEKGFAPDVIELQLAHVERNKVRAAYNRCYVRRYRSNDVPYLPEYVEGLLGLRLPHSLGRTV
jgi:integrase